MPVVTGRARILGLALLVEGGLLVVAHALGGLLGTAPFARYDAAPGDALVLGTLATIPMLLLFMGSMRSNWAPLARIRNLLETSFMPLLRGCGPLELLAISVLAGVGEEALFRGVIQVALAEWLGLPFGLALASLLFGFAHAVTLAYLIIATLMGAYLGALFEWGGGIVPPVLAHTLYDFFALVYLQRALGTRDGPQPPAIDGLAPPAGPRTPG